MTEAQKPEQTTEAQSAAAPAAAQAETPSPAQEATAQANATASAEVAPDASAELRQRVAELEAKNTELGEQWIRAQAEMQNTRRISAEEVSKARKFAVEGFAENMLPVVDSLEAGLAIKEASPEQIREGAEATLRQLVSALERSKVLAINPAAGEKFDPAKHQAISMVPAEQEANTVVAVLQKGYTIAERVLRPALVTVAAPK
jgi:molecular chaperone GrpE